MGQCVFVLSDTVELVLGCLNSPVCLAGVVQIVLPVQGLSCCRAQFPAVLWRLKKQLQIGCRQIQGCSVRAP